jgi:NHL repeat
VFTKFMNMRIPVTTIVTAAVMLATAVGVHAAPYTGPVKEVPSDHFGREVNLAETQKHGGPALEDFCSVESGDTCQPGRESSIAGGFAHPSDVAIAGDGDVYIADAANHRVQELNPNGEFILMFGGEVDETTKGDVCTAASKDICKVGVEGVAAGQFGQAIGSVTVDRSTGDVYVQDYGNHRVDAYTFDGVFVLSIGGDVDETTGGSVCTAASKDTCKVGVPGPEHSAFTFEKGPVLAVGGPDHLLYVGDEHRVQELDPSSGEWKGEISLTSISSEPGSKATALAVDDEPASPKYGHVYLVYRIAKQISTGVRLEGQSVIREFGVDSAEVKDEHFPLMLSPREPESTEFVSLVAESIAIDSSDRLAVSEFEAFSGGVSKSFGSLYDDSTSHLISEFAIPSLGAHGIAFGGKDELYAAVTENHEIVTYRPVPVAELVDSQVACKAGAEHESDATFACTLNGEVNPEGVPQTAVWFQWGRTPALGSETHQQVIATGSVLEPVTPAPVLEGLRPNATYYYRLAGFDENVQAPESPLSSETGSFVTDYVAPKVVGEPGASFVKSSSAVMSGELNPENARTEYFFEYAPGEALASCPGVRRANCPSVASTAVLASALYGKIGATLEAGGLVAGTVYHYRLAAESENAGKTEKLASKGPEGSFTTVLAPAVQAATGFASALSSTSALVSGMVNPDGAPAIYRFELGVNQGQATQYGVAFSGPVEASVVSIPESLVLTGLQPGTEYAYRIAIGSGYGAAQGATETFTTTGLPAGLISPNPLPMLPVPAIHFPAAVVTKPTMTSCKRGYTRNKNHKCVKSKESIKRKARREKGHH